MQTYGNMDIPALLKLVTPERHWETIVVGAEAVTRECLPACSRAKGETITDSLSIVDLKGFGLVFTLLQEKNCRLSINLLLISLTQFWGMKKHVRDCFQLTQDYYPETLGKLLVINAPSSFTIIWAVVKPWLAKETIAKIDILGTDYKDVLLTYVDAENLPSTLGGDCTCEGLGGCAFSCAGPWMDGREQRRRELYGDGDGTVAATMVPESITADGELKPHNSEDVSPPSEQSKDQDTPKTKDCNAVEVVGEEKGCNEDSLVPQKVASVPNGVHP